MTRSLNRLAVLLLPLSMAAACAGNPGPQDGPLPPAPTDGTAAVQVSNNNWSDMTVYVERNGMRSRLGTVTSMAKRFFEIPSSFITATGSLRLVADPIGSQQTYTTAPLQVWPGQRVDFSIENHLSISSVAVW